MGNTRTNKVQDPNRYRVSVTTESGCNVIDGEFQVDIVAIENGSVGEHDHHLVHECIWEWVGLKSIKPEQDNIVNVVESGEWEDVFWHKYYIVSNEQTPLDAVGVE